jgi:hypothetical protein
MGGGGDVLHTFSDDGARLLATVVDASDRKALRKASVEAELHVERGSQAAQVVENLWRQRGRFERATISVTTSYLSQQLGINGYTVEQGGGNLCRRARRSVSCWHHDDERLETCMFACLVPEYVAQRSLTLCCGNASRLEERSHFHAGGGTVTLASQRVVVWDVGEVQHGGASRKPSGYPKGERRRWRNASTHAALLAILAGRGPACSGKDEVDVVD